MGNHHLGLAADDLADLDGQVVEVLHGVGVEPVDRQVLAGDAGADLVVETVEVVELAALVVAGRAPAG